MRKIVQIFVCFSESRNFNVNENFRKCGYDTNKNLICNDFFSYEAMIHKWHIVGVWKLSSHPVWFCFIWTVWQLPDDCLMIAWWLPETAWWLLDDCLMNMWWLSDDYLMPAWWLPDDWSLKIKKDTFFWCKKTLLEIP